VHRQGRQVEVAVAVELVAEMALVLEDAEHRPDCRIARRIREPGEDVGRADPALAIDDVHDLPLATAEIFEACLLHGSLPAPVLEN